MGVVTVRSKAITERDAKRLANGNIASSEVKEFVGVAAITSGDDIASKYLMGSIPSNARMSELLLSSPDIGTTTAANIGLQETTENGGAVVDADFFSAALSLKDGALAKANVLNGNVQTLANSEKMIWELLNLAKDPCKQYDVVIALTAAADASGTVSMIGRYTV